MIREGANAIAIVMREQTYGGKYFVRVVGGAGVSSTFIAGVKPERWLPIS